MLNPTSVIELDKTALKNNILFLKELFGNETRFSSVVKGNAYGHGIEQFVPIAEAAGVDHFSVFSVKEAARVFEVASKSTSIMIMGWIDSEDLKWAIENKIEFWIFNEDRLDKALEISKKLNHKARIHLEIETGLNRTGLSNKSLDCVIDKLNSNTNNFILEGLCTHYAGAESIANYVRIQKQIKKFNKAYQKCLKMGLKPRYRHTACSAAALNYPQTRMDLVRVGIAQYGYWPSSETYIQYIHNKEKKIDPLSRVISWKTKVMAIKNVKQGEFVSYGTSYLAQEERTIAIIPVGYSTGFARSLSNSGRVLIHGQRVGVIGMVNMNMMIADITPVDNVKIGDEVVLIGKQGDLNISVSSFSEISEQVNYELLVRLPGRTVRKVVN
ncbi:MAG TPA: alanine racemase [Bacteroidales bacterium]